MTDLEMTDEMIVVKRSEPSSDEPKGCFARLKGYEKSFWQSDDCLSWFRWLAIIFYGLALMTMACISFSWQQYSLLLFQGGAYDWLCTEEELLAREDFGTAACLDQDKHVGDLYSLLTTAQAASGALAGIIVDHLGRRACAGLGVVMSILSVVLLVESSQSFQALPAAIFLDGLSCNLIAFPSLVLAEYFPLHPVAATSFVLTAEFGGAIVCPCLFYLWKANRSWTYGQVWYTFALAVTLPLGVLYFIALPPRFFDRRKIDEEEAKVLSRIRAAGSPDSLATPESSMIEIDQPTQSADKSIEASIVEQAPPPPKREKLMTFLRILKTPDFLNFEVVFNLFMLQHTFYPVILRDMSGATIAEYQGLFQMSQAFWCLSCGAICDYCCTATAMAALTVTSTVVLLLSLVPSHGLQYFVTSIFTIAHSYVYAIRFTFVREAFGAEHRGKILGAIGIGSALTTLLNIPINRTTRYHMWCILMSGIILLQAPSIYYLHRRYRKWYHYRAPTKHLRLCSQTENED